MAAGVIAVAVRRGVRVPEGLSVAGFDDSPFARLAAPPLTTVHQPVAEIVEAAIDMLISGAKAIGESGDQLQLPCTVIERSSTAPIAGGA
jgi:LacI family transcriptional regulator